MRLERASTRFFVSRKAERLVESFPATLLNIEGGEEMTRLFRLLSRKNIFFLNFSRFSHTNLLIYPPLFDQAATEFGALATGLEAFAPDLIVCDVHLFGDLYRRLTRFAPVLFNDPSGTLGGYRRPFDRTYGVTGTPSWVKSLVEWAGKTHETLYRPAFYLWHWRRFLKLRGIKRRYRAVLGPGPARQPDAEFAIGLGWIEREMLGETLGDKTFFPPVVTSGEPIAADLAAWIAQQDRIIYVSFGSVVALDRPALEGLATSLKDAGLPVIWSAREADEIRAIVGDDPRFFVTPWVAQSTLLRDPRVCLFVTQAGASSVQEALTGGVPMLCVPVFADQSYIASLVERLGAGVQVPKRKLRHMLIKQVAGDPLYRERAQAVSRRIADAGNGLGDLLRVCADA